MTKRKWTKAGIGAVCALGFALPTSAIAQSGSVIKASASGMVVVEGGLYLLGTASPSAEALPPRRVAVAEFYLDEFEVTNEQYRRFVDAVGAPPARTWPRGAIVSGTEVHPVRGVEYAWAKAYCTSLGKRLPSEAEWEAGARGKDGRLYPWGDDGEAVDLDKAGSRPIGAVPLNISPSGVHDTVGSAWEWVDQSVVPIPANRRVRKGGEYGRVRFGAAMRQVVNPATEVVVVETGFRCAATTVDPSVKSGVFQLDHPPAVVPTPAAPAAAPSGVLLSDNFEDSRSGWATVRQPTYFMGYHAPGWYHLDASAPGEQVLSLLGVQYGDVTIKTTVSVDRTDSPGRYRYGIVFRAHGPTMPPEDGVVGPDRPENFYAFVVDPKERTWELIHDDTLPLRWRAGGRLPTALRVTDSASPDELTVAALGSRLTFSVNGRVVGQFNTKGYHLQGDLGFYLETLDQTRAHIHFDSITVTPLDSRRP